MIRLIHLQPSVPVLKSTRKSLISGQGGLMRKAVYAGSFDPLTRGHLWMITEGARLFDQLVVAIGVNPDKHYTLPLEERLQMLKESTVQFPNVKVDSFAGKLLINYARSVGAGYLLRGIRILGDYEYERMLRYVNSDLCAEIQSVFLIPPREIAEVSSSMVKSLLGAEGWEEVIGKYVPEPVARRLFQKFSRSKLL